MRILIQTVLWALLLGAASVLAESVDLEAGPLGNQADAEQQCPAVCESVGSWNGNWKTTVPGRMSVCGCRMARPSTVALEAGPLWSNDQARGSCVDVCGGRTAFTGGWWTTVQGQMSVCLCEVGWRPKSLDDSRGNCVFNPSSGHCVRSQSSTAKNCWRCDDEYRDRLVLESNELTLVVEIRPGVRLDDGRYIYVLREKDNRLLARPYDREDSASSCGRLYKKSRFTANFRGENLKYLHVRHSQLNSGWDAVLAAGEMKVLNGEIVAINNESGHFKPPASTVNRVVDRLKRWKIPLSRDLRAGEFHEVSAKLTSEECWSILHDELR